MNKWINLQSIIIIYCQTFYEYRFQKKKWIIYLNTLLFLLNRNNIFFVQLLHVRFFFFKFLRSKLSQIAYLSLSTVKCWNNKISGHCTSFLMIDRQYVDVKSFISLHCWNAARPKKRIYFYTKLRTISTEKWKKNNRRLISVNVHDDLILAFFSRSLYRRKIIDTQKLYFG